MQKISKGEKVHVGVFEIKFQYEYDLKNIMPTLPFKRCLICCKCCMACSFVRSPQSTGRTRPHDTKGS